MLCATIGLVSFTLLCWKTGSDVGFLPAFPGLQGIWGHRAVWLGVAIAALVFAKLIDAFAGIFSRGDSLKGASDAADELPADGLRPALVLPE